MRVACEGWVDNHCGGPPEEERAIFSHRVMAAVGSYPARAASSTPFRSASCSMPREFGRMKASSPAAPSTVLVDDLGTWVTAHLDALGGWDGPRGQLDELYEHLAAACKQVPDSVEVILVSPEVGMGVIPEHHAGRLFRDEIGTLNQMMAALSDRVYLVVAGQSLALK